MNRLIIIGNGFDLAHGIKTSYKDFIADYLCNAINTFFENRIYSDDFADGMEKRNKESQRYNGMIL